MSKTDETKALWESAMMPVYAPETTITSGKGVIVRNSSGQSLYDFTSGIGVQNVGHCHPKVTEAIREQAAKLTHCSNLFANEPAGKLAAKLVELSGLGGKAFFCNSGAEANEAAIKLARKYGAATGGRYRIVTMRQSFHGRTLATLAATGQSWCQEGYDPLPAGFAYADFNDLESVKAAVDDDTVAIMLECVQGEGGVTPATEEFIKGVRTLCDEKDMLMICDEVQTGMGRTGTWFSWQGYGVEPDLFTLAKALGGGLPIGALVSNAKCADVFTPGSHASTFGGNPVAAAAALAVIDVIQSEGVLENVAKTSALAFEAFQAFVDKYPKLLEVRGKGLLIGIAVDGDPKPVVEAFRDQSVLVLTAKGNVVRIMPPLTIKENDLVDAIEMMSDALDCLYGEE